MRPVPWHPKPIPTVWLDHKTGVGVDDSGASVQPRIGGRRKYPNLADLLDTALARGAQRLMLTGPVPDPVPGQDKHWLVVPTPQWTPLVHWLGTPPTGRFEHEVTHSRLEVRLAAEWFGTATVTPAQARAAWAATADALRASDRKAELFLSPAATGTNLWALSLPRTIDPEPLPEDVAELLHRTAGQHRIEHLTTGPAACTCGGCRPLVDLAETPRGAFAYTDGRFMYASLCRELGTGPVTRLTGPQAAELIERDPFCRARFRVRFTVPDYWDHVGLLGVQHENVRDGWHYPNVPGAGGECWADAVEVRLALDHGWTVEVLEGLSFAKGRVLDTWADRLVRARRRAAEMPGLDLPVRRATQAALRAILIQGIGAFASRGRETTRVVWSARDVPAQYAHDVRRYGEAFVYREPARGLSGNNAAYQRIELAAQVWARGRARVLSCPSALSVKLSFGAWTTVGALEVDPTTLLGINGDAIFTTSVEPWSLPTQYGGGDDGREGRLRLQGFLPDVKLPASAAERNKLREQAVAAGIDGALPYSPKASEETTTGA